MNYLINTIICILSVTLINLKPCYCLTVPKSPCPQTFWYESVNNEIVGKIIITDFRINFNNSVLVRITNTNGNKIRELSLTKTLKNARIDVENGLPLNYIVKFLSQNVIPEIVEIKSNGRTICKNQESISSGWSQKTHYVTFSGSSKYPIKSGAPPTQKPSPTPSTSQNVQNVNPLFKQTEEICGKRDFSVSLMLNGNSFKPGTWPWLTAIFRKSTDKFICGGSLISHTTVLTAAHCFLAEQPDPNDYMVGIGVHDLQKHTETGSLYSDVKKIFLHSDYDFATSISYSDIALVILTTYVNYNNQIRPICLWKFDDDINMVIDRKCYVAGWGLSDPNSGKLSTNIPSYVETKIVSESDCLKSHSVISQITSSTTFCAGLRNGNGPCLGDSGSGLVMELANRFYIRGLVSQSIGHGKNICDLEQYVIYTDVVKFTTWIKRRMTP